jgi:hypothetical protein
VAEDILDHDDGRIDDQAEVDRTNRQLFFSAAIIIMSFLPLFTLTGIEGHIFGPMARTYAHQLVLAQFDVGRLGQVAEDILDHDDGRIDDQAEGHAQSAVRGDPDLPDPVDIPRQSAQRDRGRRDHPLRQDVGVVDLLHFRFDGGDGG